MYFILIITYFNRIIKSIINENESNKHDIKERLNMYIN